MSQADEEDWRKDRFRSTGVVGDQDVLEFHL